ncbi:autotransporter assembly complex protein TamA [Estrella lausannensis]|uniref:Conserved putative secreted protein n=1 Tax=Estrella lausannensis TaxID=483423 RepID=A0A0H5DNX7_9BACT|nr:BamA/TamA family outer membrane protein [Estrella lausannensis]CRX38126.1 Conserved putative secreted protein [Estrella lausannensis]
MKRPATAISNARGFLLTLALMLALLTPLVSYAAIPYEVSLTGIESECVESLVRSSSQLVNLINTPPATRLALKKRAESDVPNIINALHSQGYWGSAVELDYDFDTTPANVIVKVNPGPLFPLGALEVIDADTDERLEVNPADLTLCLEEPLLPIKIRAAEEFLLNLFDTWGYPYASITDTEVIACLKTETIVLRLRIKRGSLMYFGDVRVVGNEKVCTAYFFKKLAWSRGELYCPRRIKATRRELEGSGLFTLVDIYYPEGPAEGQDLPITIEVKEGKNRTIGIGANFATQRGLGFSGEWEHRNFKGMGEVLTVKTNLWWDTQMARLSYLQPDLYCKGEDLIWLYEFNREVTEGYTAKSLSAFARIEKEMNSKLKISYGIGYKHLRDTHIHEKKRHQTQKDRDEEFNLIKTPFSAFYNGTDDLLDPSKGMTFRFSTTPTVSITDPVIFYSINTMTYTFYKPIWNDKTIFAFRTTLGSIFGARKTTIPRSELFDAGGDTLLRGYKYKTVSPLDDDYDPTGGRSMLISSLEIRQRWSKDFGGVVFFDIGNVYASPLPNLQNEMLRSAGFGIRYYTLVAPIRLDVAFPLTPRKHVDKQHYQIYFSVGQAF